MRASVDRYAAQVWATVMMNDIPVDWRARKFGALRSAVLFTICVVSALEAGHYYIFMYHNLVSVCISSFVVTSICLFITRRLVLKAGTIEYVLLAWFALIGVAWMFLLRAEENS